MTGPQEALCILQAVDPVFAFDTLGGFIALVWVIGFATGAIVGPLFSSPRTRG